MDGNEGIGHMSKQTKIRDLKPIDEIDWDTASVWFHPKKNEMAILFEWAGLLILETDAGFEKVPACGLCYMEDEKWALIEI